MRQIGYMLPEAEYWSQNVILNEVKDLHLFFKSRSLDLLRSLGMTSVIF